MKKGDRVKFSGRKGTVIRSMPNGMIDIRFDGSSVIERRGAGRLARANPSFTRKELQAELKRLKLSATGTTKNLQERYDGLRQGYERLGGYGRVGTTQKRVSTPAKRVVPVGGTDDARLRQDRKKRKPKEHKGAPPKRKQQVGRSQERVPSLSLLTKEDPPRLNRAKTAYCGNPIDGTAYYAFIPAQATSSFQWITKENIKPFLLAGVSVEDAVEAYFNERKANSGEGSSVSFFKQSVAKGKIAEKRIKMKGKQMQKASRARGRDFQDDPSLYLDKGGKSVAPSDAAVGYDHEKEQEVNYRLKVTEVSSSALKRDYNFYKKRRYTVVALPDHTPAVLGHYVAATVGVSTDMALAMIYSQMVTVFSPSEWKGGKTPDDPNYNELGAGYHIEIGDLAKDNSPFYSFVPMPYSPTNLRKRFAPCFTADEREDLRLLQIGARVLNKYASALKSAIGLFDYERKITPAAPAQSLQRLLSAYAAVNRWWEDIDNDDLEELRDRIQSDAPLADLAAKTPVSASLHQFRGIAFSAHGTESLYGTRPKAVVSEMIEAANSPLTTFGRVSNSAIRLGKDRFGFLLEMAAAMGIEITVSDTLRGTQATGQILSTMSTKGLEFEERRTLYALLFAYYALGGLDAAKQVKKAANQLQSLSASIQGGEKGFSGTGQVVLMTYNPLLFQLLSQTWKTTFTLKNDLKLVNEVDTIGRLGSCMTMIHESEVQGIQDVQKYLWNQFIPAEKSHKKQMERSKGTTYTNALLFWPFGAGKQAFFDQATSFISNPVAYVKQLRATLSIGLARISRPRKKGEKRSLPQTDHPIDWSLSREKGPISRASSSRVSAKRRQIEDMIAAIDRRLRKGGRE